MSHQSKAIVGTLFVALTMVFIWAVAMRSVADSQPLGWSLLLLLALLVVTWFDLDHFRIPNWISWPLLFVGIGLAATGPLDIRNSMLGALLGYGLIWTLGWYWRRFRGQDGIGLGDAKLLGAAGAWLGALALPSVLLAASTTALATVLINAAAHRERPAAAQVIPFGPFIALGFWTVWMAGGLIPS